jgi:hypothetical protein
MAIHYIIRDNNLSNPSSPYFGRVIKTRTVNFDEVINRMDQSGSTVSRADILSVMETFHSVLESYLADGASVHTPHANFSSGISGVFKDKNDHFDRSRHRIIGSVNPGNRLRAFYKNTTFPTRKETLEKNRSRLESVSNQNPERAVNQARTGDMLKISGYRLRFDPQDKQEGIFLINNNRQEIRVNIVGLNTPRTLIFNIPENLTPGEYRLEIRSAVNGPLRSGSYPDKIKII